ncbi:hypothetical protein BgiMline_005292, partial [Biomphalaria glabrata]
YNQTESLVVYVDLRFETCPLQLYERNLLAYVTLSTRPCPDFNDDELDSALVRLHTGHLDLMMFASDFLNSWEAPPNVTASFALLFDESGE